MSEKNNLTRNFTAASTFPVKVICNSELMNSINYVGKIFPVHLQLNPSNKCNFHCGFCSCENRDRTSMLPLDKAKELLDTFKKLGGQCCTVTGGGDPLTYPYIHELLACHKQLGLEVGLVCNGGLLYKLKAEDYKCITWIRISSSDELPEQTNLMNWFKIVAQAVADGPNINWAFSYVVSKTPSMELIEMIVRFANLYQFTHVRLVSDLLDIKHSGNMAYIKNKLREREVDDSLVIYQGRKEFCSGTNKCYISLAKPVVSAEGNILPCCGVMYALDHPSLDYEKSMIMGSISDLQKLVDEQKFFDGSKCVRCYYSEYNELFATLKQPLVHRRFI